MTLFLEWTDDRETKLRELHEGGLSASQIAFELGGTTRNAVIGKRARMKLAPVNNPGKDNSPRAPRKHSQNKASAHVVFRIVAANGNSNAMRVVKSVKFDPAPLRCVEVQPRHLTLMQLEPNDCRFPFGGDTEGSSITFCGLPKRDDKTSYCASHHFLSWRAPLPPKHRAFVGPMARAAS